MRALVVPVVHECLMRRVDLGFVDVRLVEGFHLSDGGRSPHARDDMLNSVSPAGLGELGYASSCGIGLRILWTVVWFVDTA